MRRIAFIAMLGLAACGGESQENKAQPKAESFTAGQWELTSEVTAFSVVDGGTPQIDTPVGTRATETVCIGEGRPPAEMFAGPDYDCRYDSYYARHGRLNATLICRREGLSGNIPVTGDGTFETDSLDFSREIRTAFAGDGDVRISARVTGRRTGECAPETPGGNNVSADAQG